MDVGRSSAGINMQAPGFDHTKLNVTMKTMKEYLQTRSETTLQKLLQDLHVLESSDDFTVLDMSTMMGAQFHMDLYNLLTTIETSSPLIWTALSLLQKACVHSNGVSHLTLSYRYTPFLGRLLSESLTHEKKLRLLAILQTFTNSMSIQWQEAYLKPMLCSLSDCVTSSNATEATLALSTIVNILNRNHPVARTFLRCVSMKDLLKQLMNRDFKSLEFRLEVCKFMIIMADVTQSHPDLNELKKFIGLTFQTVVECVRNGNLCMIRQNVNFFGDVTQIEKLKPDLLAYPSYETDVKSVLVLLEEDQLKRDCESILLQFLNNVVALHPPMVAVLLPRIAGVASKTIRSGDMSARASALALLLSLSRISVDTELQAVTKELFDVLPVLVELVKKPIPRKEAITLLELLCEFTNVSTMKKALLAALNPNMVRVLFEPLTQEWEQTPRALSVDDAIFYVEALSLTSKFAAQDAAWLQQFSLLMQQRCVQFALATALKSAPPRVKCSVLQFPSIVGCSATCISGLAQCLYEDSSVEDISGQTRVSCTETHQLFRITEQNRLDSILSRLEKFIEGHDSKDVPLGDLMSIFEYRLAEESREQKILNSSLGAANDRISFLLQQVDTLKEENVRFRQFFMNSQRCLEQTKIERDTALISQEAAKADAKKAFRDNEEAKRQYEVKLGELEKHNQQLQKLIEEKNREIQNQASQIQTLKMENINLEETNKADLRMLVAKDEEIKEKDSQIRQLEIIKNAIYEISSGTKKIEK